MVDMSAKKYDEPNIPDAQDEQIVNAALINPMNALVLHSEMNLGTSNIRIQFLKLQESGFHYIKVGT